MKAVTDEEYEEYKELKRIDLDLLRDISKGIKDILQGKFKEV